MIKKIGLVCFVLMLLALPSFATTLTGTITTAQTSRPISNATLGFSLNQSGVIVGSFALSTTPVQCSTSTDGSIVGLPNPLVVPVANQNLMSGSLQAQPWYIRVEYWNAGGETLPGGFTALTLGSTGSIVVTAPTLQPSGATGYKVFLGSADGNEKLQTTTTGWGATTIASFNSGGASTSATNTTVCTVSGNDTIIPSYTTYKVTLVDSNGGTIPGFGQQWYISGSTLNISNSYPIAVNVQTRFPQPLVANPSSNALQSINSPLTTNGYDFKTGATVYTGLPSHANSSAGQGLIYYNNIDNKLYASVNGGSAVDILSASGNGWTDGGANVYLTTQTDRVMAGLGSTLGDFSSSVYNSSILSNQFFYAVGGASAGGINTNATLLVLGINGGSTPTSAVIGSSVSSVSGSAVPLVFTTYNGGNQEAMRITTDQVILHGIASTDIATSVKSIFNSNISIVGSGQTTNASLISLSVNPSNYVAITSNISGSGTRLPLAFFLRGQEQARFGHSSTSASTYANFQIGTTSSTTDSQPLFIQRDQDGSTDAVVFNNSANGAAHSARASFKASSSSGDFYSFVTSADYTGNGTVSNGTYGSAGVLSTSSSLTGGLVIQTFTGSVKIIPASSSTVLATFASSGLTLSTPLAQISGGTGQSTAIANTRIPYSDGTAYQGSANLSWTNGTSRLLVNGRISAGAATPLPPITGTSVDIFYNADADNATIITANWGTGVGKDLNIGGSNIYFFVGNPATIVAPFGVTANGPQWRTAEQAGSQTVTTTNGAWNNAPNALGTLGAPSGWLKSVNLAGQIIYQPYWR